MRYYTKQDGININEPSAVTFDMHCDLLVIGLGSGGVYATIAAAQQGLSVIGIEQLSCVGGTNVAGGVFGYYFGSTGGLFEEVDREAMGYKDTIYKGSRKTCGEAKKYTFEQWALRAGAQIRYNTIFTGIYMEDGRVMGARLFDGREYTDVACKVLLDGTGDSAVCDMLGAASAVGRELDGKTVPITNMMNNIHDGLVLGTNFDCGIVDQFDPFALSKAIVDSGALHLKAQYTDEGDRMLCLSNLLGIREGRLVEGEKTVRLDDYLNGKREETPIFYAYADVDKHGFDTAFETETLCDWTVGANLGALNITVPIPYETLLPKGFSNLLNVGRSISLDHDMSNCVRMIRDMQKTGEAGGYAASLAVKYNCALKDIPKDELISMLDKTGCRTKPWESDFAFDGWNLKQTPYAVTWLDNIDTIKGALATDRPGVAIWSCRLLGSAVSDALAAFTQSADEMLSKHAAFALALIGDTRALPVLRSMVRARDNFRLLDMRKQNQIHAVMALYLCGRLKDTEIAGDLIQLITDDEEYKNPAYTPHCYEKNGAWFNDMFFQMFSHSIRALLKVGDAHKDMRPAISEALKQAVANGRYVPMVTAQTGDLYPLSVVRNVADVVHTQLASWE